MNRRISIVHPAGSYRDWLVQSLESEGFDVGPVDESIEADALLAHNPDVVLLDTDHGDNPDDGFRLCAELRLLAPRLLIVIVSPSDYECDRVSAFRVGADEYLNKKVSALFLAVRLAALVRRRADLTGNYDAFKSTTRLALTLDTEAWTASWNGETLNLSLTRLKILDRLCRLPGQVCTASDLMTAAGIRVEPNTISAHIKAIRDEFRRVDPAFDHIRSERSIGYRWVSRPTGRAGRSGCEPQEGESRR